MAITQSSGGLDEMIGGKPRALRLTNAEIERFEGQYAPLGIFELWDQLMGRGVPQARCVRDIVALGLVGGGMADRAAEALIASLGPSENFALRDIAKRLLGVSFFPALLAEGDGGKKPDGSDEDASPAGNPVDGTSDPAS